MVYLGTYNIVNQYAEHSIFILFNSIITINYMVKN